MGQEHPGVAHAPWLSFSSLQQGGNSGRCLAELNNQTESLVAEIASPRCEKSISHLVLLSISNLIGLGGLALTVLKFFGLDKKANTAGTQHPPGRRDWWIGFLIVGGICVCLYADHKFRRSEFIYNEDAKMPTIRGKSFRNEVVPLDGREYVDCTFTNVTLQYNGTTPIRLVTNRFQGTLGVRTSNRSIANAGVLFKATGIFKSEVPINDVEGADAGPQ